VEDSDDPGAGGSPSFEPVFGSESRNRAQGLSAPQVPFVEDSDDPGGSSGGGGGGESSGAGGASPGGSGGSPLR